MQIEHMKSFIEKEAQEKAEEILAKVSKYGYHNGIRSSMTFNNAMYISHLSLYNYINYGCIERATHTDVILVLRL